MNKNPLNQKVNFIISVVFIISFGLFAAVIMFKAAALENPLANYLSKVQSYEED